MLKPVFSRSLQIKICFQIKNLNYDFNDRQSDPMSTGLLYTINCKNHSVRDAYVSHKMKDFNWQHFWLSGVLCCWSNDVEQPALLSLGLDRPLQTFMSL